MRCAGALYATSRRLGARRIFFVRRVDLHLTLARSLLANQLLAPRSAPQTLVQEFWDAVELEPLTRKPLCSERERKLDFSQFTLHGHYTRSELLSNYLRAMMWLGRVSFLLTSPPKSNEPAPDAG